MKYLVSIYTWCVGLVTFTIILTIGILLSYLFPRDKYDCWFKKMLRVFFKIINVKVVVEGDTQFCHNKPYLLMSNHVSMFDLPLLAGFIPISFFGIASAHQFKWILYGWFLRRYGTIPIERENIRRSMTAIYKAKTLLDTGKSIVVLPEGYRTKDGQLQPFKKLPFYLAQQAGVDIVPIGLSGLYTLKRKSNWLMCPGVVKIKFGEKISDQQVKSFSIEKLRTLTYERIFGLIEWI